MIVAFVPVPGGARFTVNFLSHGQVRQINLGGWKLVGNWSLAELTTVAGNLLTALNTYLMPIMANNVALQSITGRDLSTQFGSEANVPNSPVITGSLANPAPGNVTETISLRTGSIGRRNRGRVYPPQTGGGNINSDDTLLPSFMTALGTLSTHIASAYPLGFLWSVISLTQGKSIPIVQTVVAALVDSQRRRLVGRGR